MEKYSIFITLFLVLTIGIVLLISVSDIVKTQVTQNNQYNESIDISSARGNNGEINMSKNTTFTPQYANTGTRGVYASSVECYFNDDFILKNITNGTLTTGADYFLTESTGQFYLNATSPSNVSNKANTTYASYGYCPTGFIIGSLSKSGIRIVVGLLAIVLLVVLIIYFFESLKWQNK